MTRSRLSPIVFVAAALFAAAAAPPVRAQVTVAKPIVLKPPKQKTSRVKLQGEVMNSTAAQITVRDLKNERVIRTFTFSPEVARQMQHTIDGGGYQYGDRVVIEFEAGRDVALKIKGKPSKLL